MKKIFTVAKISLLLICVAAIVGASTNPQASGFRIGEVQISGTGILFVQNNLKKYLLVPQENYPAELRGISAIDVREKVYVARFFEPGGVGVEGFFDVCFQLDRGKIMKGLVKNSASLERIGGSTYIKACTYIYDSDKRLLFKTDSTNPKASVVPMIEQLKPFNN